MFGRSKEPQPEPGFHGVWAAAVTPHRRDGHEADFAAMLELVDWLGQGGVDGIVLLGATGEFLNVRLADRQRLVHLAVKRSRVPIIAGVGHSTLDGAIELADAAIDSGAAGLLLMPPYFYRYRGEEVLAFYEGFASASGGALPLLLYNIPAFTNAIPLEVAGELLRSGLYAGIKDSSGDKQLMADLASLRAQSTFSLLCGNDRLIVEAMALGASGVVSGVACAVPELVVALCKSLRDPVRTERLERSLLEFVEWIERFPVPVGISAATEARGKKVGPPAVPLPPDMLKTLDRFREWFGAWLPGILDFCHAGSNSR